MVRISLKKGFCVFAGMLAIVILVPSVFSQEIHRYGPAWEEVCSEDICTRMLYSGPVAYWNGSEYAPINTTLKPYGQDGYDYIMNEGLYTLYVKSHSNWGDGIKYCVNSSGEEKCLIYQSQDYSFRDVYGSQDYISSIADVSGTIDGNKVIYGNCYTNVTLEFHAENGLLKENYIVGSLPKEPAEYLTEPVTLDFGGYIKYGDLDLFLDGIEVTDNDFVTNHSIEFRDGEKTLFYLPEPTAYDSANNLTSIEYEVKKQGDQFWFYVRTPFSWLENASYPVTVDPTVQLQTPDFENIDDTYIIDESSSNFGNSGILKLDYQWCLGPYPINYWEIYNILFRWNLSGIPTGAYIENVTLSVYQYSVGVNGDLETGENFDTCAHHIYQFPSYNISDQEWNETSVNGFNRPNTSSQMNMTNESCFTWDGATTEEDWASWSVTQMVKKDFDDGYKNVSIYLMNSTNYYSSCSALDYIAIRSGEYTGDTSQRPKLTVVYYPGGVKFNSNITDPTTPIWKSNVTVTANVSDESGGNIVSVNFTVTAPNGTAMINNANGTQSGDVWNSTWFITDVDGSWNVSITARDDEGYEDTAQWNFTITNHAPVFNSNFTDPASPTFEDSVLITTNISESDTNGWIASVNFTVEAPNGTKLLDNVNGTQDGDIWNSTAFVTDVDGSYNITIYATDDGGEVTTSTWNFSINLGTLSVETHENDQDYVYSQVAGQSEFLNLTISSSGANSNNTINFTLLYDMANSTRFTLEGYENFTLEPSISNLTQINITSNASLTSGDYGGYINISRQEDGDFILIEVNVTVATAAANIDIINLTWSVAVEAEKSADRYFEINNTGNYNATSCTLSYSDSGNFASASFGQSGFTVEPSIPVTVKATFTGVSAGTDSSAYIRVNCTATASGGKDSDTITGSVSVSASTTAGPGGGGGGGVTPEAVCGNGFCEYAAGEDADNCPEDCVVPVANFSLLVSPDRFSRFTIPNTTYVENIDVKNPTSEYITVKIYVTCITDDPSCGWITFLDEDKNEVTEMSVRISPGSEILPSRHPVQVTMKIPDNISVENYQANMIFEAQGMKVSVPYTLKSFEALGIWGWLGTTLQSIWDYELLGPFVNEIPLFGKYVYGYQAVLGFVVMVSVLYVVVRIRNRSRAHAFYH